MAALGEADTITSDSHVPGPGQVDIDGGDGADRATTKGTDGDDEIGIARNGTDVVATFADRLRRSSTTSRSRTSPCRASRARTACPASTASAR